MAKRKADEKREQLSVGVEEELKRRLEEAARMYARSLSGEALVSLAPLLPAGAGGSVSRPTINREGRCPDKKISRQRSSAHRAKGTTRERYIDDGRQPQ